MYTNFINALKALGTSQAIKLAMSRRAIKHLLPRFTEHLSIYRKPFHFRHGTTDKYVVFEVLVCGQYDCICHFNDVRTIVDAGANIGTASVTLLNAYPESTLIALEPDIENFQVLSANLSPYDHRAVAIQKALWCRNETLAVERGSFRDGGHWSYQVRQVNEANEAEVTGVTLPTLMEENSIKQIDILKVDIEGAERFVFDDSAREWMNSVRCIAIELHDNECQKRFFAVVDSLEGSHQRVGEVTIWQRH